MTVSMRVMSAGQGYRYLLKSVAAADRDRHLASPLVDYYTVQGTPPGRWLGSGVAHVGAGSIEPGDVVTEAQLKPLLGEGRDPVTGAALGRAFPTYRSRRGRISERVEALDPSLSAERRSAQIKTIETEESARKIRRAVAGLDFTFSAPKSVSVLWALAEPDTRAAIEAAHHAAIADVIELMERDVAATRVGATGPDGAVAQVDVTGLIATAFDHYDSRAGDPQLHTHVVIANKVKTVVDGRWRSLDGRPLHAAVVSLSEYYNAVLADRLTQDLGVAWQRRDRGTDRNPAWEIAGVPAILLDAFSSRSAAINAENDRLMADYVASHGHRPSATTVIKLRQQATLATRPDKTVQSLADLSQGWRTSAARVLGQSATGWAEQLIASSREQLLLRAGDLDEEVVAELGATAVEMVGERRSTWRRWNLHAEASRRTMHLRFATPDDRDQAVSRIVTAAEAASIRLTPPELAPTPAELQRTDGTSVLRPRHATRYTSHGLLAAEDQLLQLSDTTSGPTVPQHVLDAVALRHDADRPNLDTGQVTALAAIIGSGRVVDVLVGPAGAGKTTAMRGLRHAWETAHGTGSAIGLAPSAAAAQVLADDLGIATENTAKWLYDHTTRGGQFEPGQLVILDEASLAGTLTLGRIAAHADEADAKLLLVGDWAQLGAVQASGAFGMLVRNRTHAPELHDVHRFTHGWERNASLQLRLGSTAAVDTYAAHDRLRDGDAETMLDQVYQAWTADVASGRTSLMIAQTADTVTALNIRARADRIEDGHVSEQDTVSLHDRSQASAGDVVISRRNIRMLQAGSSWVKNGDRWRITATYPDGALTVQPAKHGRSGPSVRLPAEYVAAHVELGYATTVHRAQGATVDTAHAIVDARMTRETLYVAMTRGRTTNTAYVTTDQPDIEDHLSPVADRSDGRTLLDQVLKRVGAELSVHEAIRTEHDAATSVAQLAAEYETIAAAAHHHRWTNLIRRSGLTSGQANDVIDSPAFGALTAKLRLAEAHHHNPETLLPRLVASRQFDDADDIAAVLHHRLSLATQRRTGTSTRQAPRLIVGLIPEAASPTDPEMREALQSRRDLLHQRVDALIDAAIEEREPWTLRLDPPTDAARRPAWRRDVATVVAYRDRYGITNPTQPLGHTVESDVQRDDAKRAAQALRRMAARRAQRADPSIPLPRRAGPAPSPYHSL